MRVIPLEVPDTENKDGNVTRRTLLKGAAALAATGATVKAASAATERPLGETGVPLGDTQPLPLGPLPGSRYPDPHIEALGKRLKGSPGTGSVERLSPTCVSAVSSATDSISAARRRSTGSTRARGAL